MQKKNCENLLFHKKSADLFPTETVAMNSQAWLVYKLVSTQKSVSKKNLTGKKTKKSLKITVFFKKFEKENLKLCQHKKKESFNFEK